MQPDSPSLSRVVPVLNAERFLPGLFEVILSQKPAPPREIVLVDSNSTDRTREIAAACPIASVVPLDRFSHGRSRNLGAAKASGEVVVFLSQDALPADENWLAELVTFFADPSIAATYSRQVPREDAPPMVRHRPPSPRAVASRSDGDAVRPQTYGAFAWDPKSSEYVKPIPRYSVAGPVWLDESWKRERILPPPDGPAAASDVAPGGRTR